MLTSSIPTIEMMTILAMIHKLIIIRPPKPLMEMILLLTDVKVEMVGKLYM